MFKVYALICPTRKTIRYIGVTGRDVKIRLAEHLKLPRKINPYKYNWIQKLKRSKKTPGILVLSEHEKEEDAYLEEIRLIAFFRKTIGKRLTNLTAGGDRPGKFLGKKNGMYGKTSKTSYPAKPVWQLEMNGRMKKKFSSLAEASKATGVHWKSISKCCRKKCKSAGKFKWRYA